METNRRAIVSRLEKDGWASVGGTKHEKFTHSAKPGVLITVPYHRTVTPGVADSIRKAAGWPK